MIKSILTLLFVCMTASCTVSIAERLPINLQASRVNIDIVSTLISTTATVKKIDGYLDTTGTNPSDIKIFIATKGSDVALEKLPFDQMLLVSSLLQAVSGEAVTFESDSVTKDTHGYILNGIATSGKHREKVSLPVSISRLNQGRQYLIAAVYSRNGTVGGKNSDAGKLLGPISTKGDLNIAFGG